MRILIVEFDATGHRLYYVRLLAAEALAAGAEVRVLVGAEPHKDQFITTHLGDLAERLMVVRTASADWRTVEATATEFDASITVVPEADAALLPIARRGGWRAPGRLSLLVMRPQVPLVRSRLRRPFATAGKRLLLLVLPLVPGIRLHVLRSVFDTSTRPWRRVADPVGMTATPEDAEQLRAAWSLDAERYWFGLLGAITANKNARLVLESVRDAAAGRPLGVLLAGRIEPGLAESLAPLIADLKADEIRVVLVDRLLSNLELDSAVRAVDCLVLAYQHLGSSGTLGKAAAAGTRLVLAGSPTLRDDAAAIGPGATWCELTGPALSRSLQDATRRARPEPLDLADEHTFATTLLGDL